MTLAAQNKRLRAKVEKLERRLRRLERALKVFLDHLGES